MDFPFHSTVLLHLARPQIFLNPLVRSGLLVVEEKRRVTLDCFVDSSNHPPVTGLRKSPN